MNPLLLQMGPMILWDIWLCIFFPGYGFWTTIAQEAYRDEKRKDDE